jgi:hypothetical protein
MWIWRLKGGVVEEQTPTTSEENEDVEAHRLPPVERPPAEAASEEPDFEGHSLLGRPPAERPPAE